MMAGGSRGAVLRSAAALAMVAALAAEAQAQNAYIHPSQVESLPVAFDSFIRQAPSPFAATPGAAYRATRSLSAEAWRYGGASAAARALGFGSVAKLQTAIRAFCQG
jgi:hypothetical protein